MFKNLGGKYIRMTKIAIFYTRAFNYVALS